MFYRIKSKTDGDRYNTDLDIPISVMVGHIAIALLFLPLDKLYRIVKAISYKIFE